MSGSFNSRQRQAYYEMSTQQDTNLHVDMEDLKVDKESFSLKNAVILLRNIGYKVSNGEVDGFEDKYETQRHFSMVERVNRQYAALASLQTHDLEEMSAEEHKRITQEKNAMVIVLDHNYTVTPPEQVPFGFTNSPDVNYV